MTEFEINGVQYRSSRMPLFQQFHIVRKLLPLFGKLGPGAEQAKALVNKAASTVVNEGGSIEEALQEADAVKVDASFFNLLAPVLEELAAMSEDDCNYVLHRCLAVVQVRSGNGWSPIWNSRAQALQFENINMMDMMQIVFHVMQDNLGNFTLSGQSLNSAQPSPMATNTPASLSAFPAVRTG